MLRRRGVHTWANWHDEIPKREVQVLCMILEGKTRKIAVEMKKKNESIMIRSCEPSASISQRERTALPTTNPPTTTNDQLANGFSVFGSGSRLLS